MRNAERQSTWAAVIVSKAEQEETESVNAELGQETLLPDGDLSGFALETLPTQLLDSISGRRVGYGLVATHQRLTSSDRIDSTSCEQNLDPQHGKEGFLAQVKHEMTSGECHEPLGTASDSLQQERTDDTGAVWHKNEDQNPLRAAGVRNIAPGQGAFQTDGVTGPETSTLETTKQWQDEYISMLGRMHRVPGTTPTTPEL